MATINRWRRRSTTSRASTSASSMDSDSRDVRSDKSSVKQYSYKRALKHSKSVKAWRDSHFTRTYPGFTVEVLDASGNVAHGRTLLSTVRDSYLEDE